MSEAYAAFQCQTDLIPAKCSSPSALSQTSFLLSVLPLCRDVWKADETAALTTRLTSEKPSYSDRFIALVRHTLQPT